MVSCKPPPSKDVKMKNILGLKDFPFLLTLLFGLLSYQFNQITTSILNSPSIEYSLHQINKEQKGDTIYKNYECLINNITNDKSFKNLTINFLCTEKSSLEMFHPEIISIPPSSRHYEEPISYDNELLKYSISILQPGDKYKMLFKSTSNSQDEKTKPSIFLTSNDTVRIINTSISTWIVKNYLSINFVLIILCVSLISIYILKLNNIKPNEKSNSL